VIGAGFTTREGCSFDQDFTECRDASEGSLVDTSCTEGADAELVRTIERRSRKGEVDPEELERFYMESVRGYEEKRRQAPRGAAAKLMDVRPKGA
jgi:hypothetical protein